MGDSCREEEVPERKDWDRESVALPKEEIVLVPVEPRELEEDSYVVVDAPVVDVEVVVVAVDSLDAGLSPVRRSSLGPVQDWVDEREFRLRMIHEEWKPSP